MLKIGVIGIGNIATKAYLPVYLNIQDQVQWHFYTRSTTKKCALKKQYGLKYVHDNFNEFTSVGLDGVMIHSPTSSHDDLVKKFLSLKIPVYVDKPLTESYEATSKLYQLAKTQDVFLMTGFNRRFAPTTLKLKELSNVNYILAMKHRPNLEAEAHFALFDEMIHVVDTTLFLFNETTFDVDYHIVVNNNNLEHASITFKTKNKTALALMNLKAGFNLERQEVMSPNSYHIAENLNSLAAFDEKGRHYYDFSDWKPISERRGFQGIVEYFVAGLNQGYQAHNLHNEISLLSHYHVGKLAEKIKKA